MPLVTVEIAVDEQQFEEQPVALGQVGAFYMRADVRRLAGRRSCSNSSQMRSIWSSSDRLPPSDGIRLSFRTAEFLSPSVAN